MGQHLSLRQNLRQHLLLPLHLHLHQRCALPDSSTTTEPARCAPKEPSPPGDRTLVKLALRDRHPSLEPLALTSASLHDPAPGVLSTCATENLAAPSVARVTTAGPNVMLCALD